jgi:tRNA G18 (ribose-2'-O)-methylase SpoU
MSVERIHDPGDPRVARFQGVRDGELIRSRGLFVAEGRHIVRRLIEDGRYRLESVLVNDAALRDLETPLSTVGAAVPILLCAGDVMEAIAGYDVHRGCLALAHRPPAQTADALIAAAPMLIVLEGVSNADNVGGVFRNAAAFRAGGVLLSPTCCDPLYRKAIRTSMGATLSVPYARVDEHEWPAVLTRMKSAGFTVAAMTPRQPSETLTMFAGRPRTGRLALVVGAEGAGLTPAVEAVADHRVRIAISDDVDSLNLAVATGIALHELCGRAG